MVIGLSTYGESFSLACTCTNDEQNGTDFKAGFKLISLSEA